MHGLGHGQKPRNAHKHTHKERHMKKLTIRCPLYRAAVRESSAFDAAYTFGGLPTSWEAAYALFYAAAKLHGVPNADYNPDVAEARIETGGGVSITVYLPLMVPREHFPAAGSWVGRAYAAGLDRRLRKWCGVIPGMRGKAKYQIANLRRNAARRDEDMVAGGFVERAREWPLTPSQFKYDRAIGVEFETFGTAGAQTVTDALPIWAQRKYDGSIRADGRGEGHEIVALLVRREMEPRLFRLCRQMERLNLRVNRTCGMHVHLDQRGETQSSVAKRATIMDKWLSALRELVPASRRENEYCRFGISQTCRYRAVNVTSFGKHRTLEIRLHSGTTDYTKALAWIRLVEMLAALGKGPRAASGCIATLEQLPLAAHDFAYWRARHCELNPHLYQSAAVSTTETE